MCVAHGIDEDIASGRAFSYLCPPLVKAYVFYLYTFSVLHQPVQRSTTAFVVGDDDRVKVAVRCCGNEQTVQVPLLAQTEDDSASLQSRIGRKQYYVAVVTEHAVLLVCVVVILRCILVHPTLLSSLLLFFLLVRPPLPPHF